MGSLQKTPTSRYWVAYFKRWDAATRTWKRTRASTKCEDRAAAESVLAQLEATATMAAGLRTGTAMTEEHARSLVLSIMNAAGVTVLSSRREVPGVLEYIERYMSQKARKVRASTYRTYSTCRNAFEAWHGKDAPLDSFTAARAEDYYGHLLKTGSSKTANDRHRWLSGVFAKAVKEGLLSRNPCLAVDRITSAPILNRLPFTLQEAQKLIGYLASGNEIPPCLKLARSIRSTPARRLEWARAALLSLQTGARLADCINMPRSSINKGHQGSVLTYRQAKTSKLINCPLVLDDLNPLITRVRAKLLCPELAEDYARLGNAHLSQEFTDLVSAAGISQKYVRGRAGRKSARKTFHSLRHTLRSAIVASGGSDAQADLVLGHSPGQGKAYTHGEETATAEVLKAALKG